MLRALVFDLDDTLYPEREFVLSGFRAVDDWLGQKRGVNGFGTLASATFERGVRGKIFDKALRKLRIADDAALIAEMVKVYREHPPSISLYRDARRTLDRFRGRKRLGIITDGFLQTQRNKVAALGIGGEFDTIIYSDEFGRENWKPNPGPYQKLMAVLGVQGPECVYVADNPQKDFVTAKKLGWQTVQIRRSGGESAQIRPDEEHRADVVIESLDELVSVVRLRLPNDEAPV